MVFSPKLFSSSTFIGALIGAATVAALIPFTSGSSRGRSTVFRGATTQDASPSDTDTISVGFIGCGTIASAIARGIATQSTINVNSIAVSRRSKAKSAALAEAFPTLVTVHDDNQEVLDKSDIIFVCVLPQQATEVLEKLKFDNDKHKLVSLMSTAKIPDLIQLSKLDDTKVSKMICLPSVAKHQGVCLHCAPQGADKQLTMLFDTMGGVVTLKDEDQLAAAMMTTCVMGPFYGIMKRGRDWLVKNGGLSESEASYLITKQYLGMVQDADRGCEEPSRLDDLIEEQTPGGVNEQALANLDALGGLDAYDEVMDAILSRIQGKTDGSVAAAGKQK
mmetsp:Transcript_21920/g.62442  ORF Transcript_21920/g.62442 Transcript_21920/m.62442 type:complete len:334 (+) Transcript_21920:55-1056(+)